MSNEYINILYWNIGLRTEDSKNPNTDNIKQVLHALSVDSPMLRPDAIFLSDFGGNNHKPGMSTEVMKLMPSGYEPFFPPNFNVYHARPIVVFYKRETIELDYNNLSLRDNFVVYDLYLQSYPDTYLRLIPVHFRSKLRTNERSREFQIEDDVKELHFFCRLVS
jgi:hypothetical protein